MSKYPPLEGGVSSRVYWFSEALARRDHDVHIVTNTIEAEQSYKTSPWDVRPEADGSRVVVHCPTPPPQGTPSHIPFSPAYCERLANLTLKVVREHAVQVIDARYLIPYAVVGYLVHLITGCPLVVRHAGSDLYRILCSTAYSELLRTILREASAVVTSLEPARFHALGVPQGKVHTEPAVTVNTEAFSPGGVADLSPLRVIAPHGQPVFGFFGKLPAHGWETKGVVELLHGFAGVSRDALLLVVAGGPAVSRVKAIVGELGLETRVFVRGFVPPWFMPSVLRALSAVVIPERGFPIPGHSPSLAMEALATGTCLILGKEVTTVEPYRGLICGEHVLTVSGYSSEEVAVALRTVMDEPSTVKRMRRAGREYALRAGQFEATLVEAERLYTSLNES